MVVLFLLILVVALVYFFLRSEMRLWSDVPVFDLKATGLYTEDSLNDNDYEGCYGNLERKGNRGFHFNWKSLSIIEIFSIEAKFFYNQLIKLTSSWRDTNPWLALTKRWYSAFQPRY